MANGNINFIIESSDNKEPLNIQIKLAADQEKSIIQNMARFYAYDLSRFCGRYETQYDWSFPEDGLYEGANYSNFWVDADHYPFIIYVNDELGGFALINKKGYIKGSDWYMAEFFIVAKFQNMGLGTEVAKQLFQAFKGKWEVAQMLSNKPAISFWRKIIKSFTKDNYTETQTDAPKPKPHKMNIFQFES